MVSRNVFERVSGLRGAYIEGDYEDSDFCLQLSELGHQNWYLPEVELYHLEGQSWNSSARQSISKYNAWLHTRIWGDRLELIMNQDADSLLVARE